MAPPYGTTTESFETQVGTNHLGHFLLTGLVLKEMNNMENPRIVVHSSTASIGAFKEFPTGYTWNQSDKHINKKYDAWVEYGNSKRANYYFAWEMQKRLAANSAYSNVSIVAVQPGYTATNLQRDRIPGWEMMNEYVAMNVFAGAQPQLVGATTQDERILHPDQPSLLGPEYAMFGAPTIQGSGLYTLWESDSRREEKQRELWKMSVELTGTLEYLTM